MSNFEIHFSLFNFPCNIDTVNHGLQNVFLDHAAVEKNAATGPSEREKPSEGSEEILPRVRREGQPSNYWWLPGSRPGQNAYFNHISCGYPGRPQFGSSLFESISAGSLVVHSCDPGYKLVGAKLRLCQSNGRWTPALPRCYREFGITYVRLYMACYNYYCSDMHKIIHSCIRLIKLCDKYLSIIIIMHPNALSTEV